MDEYDELTAQNFQQELETQQLLEQDPAWTAWLIDYNAKLKLFLPEQEPEDEIL